MHLAPAPPAQEPKDQRTPNTQPFRAHKTIEASQQKNSSELRNAAAQNELGIKTFQTSYDFCEKQKKLLAVE